MSCPTCDHTMQFVGQMYHYNIYYCPRCGTIRGGGLDMRPKLVDRIVEFCGELTEDDQDIIDTLERLGVTESVTHPDVRL